jgi:hypothetical protein
VRRRCICTGSACAVPSALSGTKRPTEWRSRKQSRAEQCRAVQSSAAQCRAVQSSAEQSSAVQCSAVQSSAVQSKAVQCRAEQCRAVQSKAEQSRAEQSSAEQSRAEQCKGRAARVLPSAMQRSTPPVDTAISCLFCPLSFRARRFALLCGRTCHCRSRCPRRSTRPVAPKEMQRL